MPVATRRICRLVRRMTHRPSFAQVLLMLGLLGMVGCSMPDQALRCVGCALLDRKPLPMPEAGRNDVSRLHSGAEPDRVLKVSSNPDRAESELRELLAAARARGTHVSIAGARHSMGGQTLGAKGAWTIDMLGLNHIGEVFQRPHDPRRRWMTVGAGARWLEIVPKLRAQGYAPKVMQSNSDFTVGGSLSVNCHGWQHNSEPIASTVDSIRLMTADGVVRRCSRSENAELFSLALGGYGLFGIILEATLEVVPDEYYQARQKLVPPAEYVATFEEMTSGQATGMAYGRISTAPSSFLRESMVTVLHPVPAPSNRSHNGVFDALLTKAKRTVFRNAVGNDRGKDFRWVMEKKHGETGGQVLRRSDILSEPAALFGNHDARFTEVLHEYFIPKNKLAVFLEKMRAIHADMACPDLLNITVRNVKPDRSTFLRYAREEVFGLVMLFHQRRGSSADEEQMSQYTQRLVDAALACGGTYYLPYRLHARRDQFARAYPMSARFFALKRRHDPHGLFQNRFFQNYASRG